MEAVHVSSIVAIMPSQPGTTMTPDSPVTSGDVPGAYALSKAESEHVARGLQDRGAPVVVYPGGVFGPLLSSLGPVEALAARSGRRVPGLREPLWLLAKAAPADASATERDLRVTARPLAETFADTIRWLHASGHVSRRAAGRLGG